MPKKTSQSCIRPVIRTKPWRKGTVGSWRSGMKLLSLENPVRETCLPTGGKYRDPVMRKITLLSLSQLLLSAALQLAFAQNTNPQTPDFNPSRQAVITSGRSDGRFLSTYGVAHAMLKHTQPKYAFNPDFTPEEFARWQIGVQTAMEELMRHPDLTSGLPPVCISSEQKDGYRQEKWEFYPLPECVSTFFVLIPDDATAARPAVLCIPGSGMTKEHLIGERSANPHAAMARNIAKRGYVAVAVDNAASGEASDLEETTGIGYDYDTPSRMLLELGWSWLGYTSYLDRQVLEWMKTRPEIRSDRIVVSGFSLGTEPLMVLGALDKSIYGFVYNDFLCNTLERAIVMTRPDGNGRRPFPNSIRHLIPRFWEYFNFPDIVASLAPRPVILTEGGMDRDFDLVRRAYEISGHPENAELHHYPKYADPSARRPMSALPEGLDRTEYFDLVNCDSPNHYFKDELILPWLDRIFADPLRPE